VTKVSIKRHIAKSITWRLVGTIDTMLFAWFLSGNPLMGVKIGGYESITKMILYYFHERAWYRYHFKGAEERKEKTSRKRHLLKTITWRAVGTVDTVAIAWVISGNPMVGLKLGGVEVISKMILYYLHERVWYRFDFGIEEKRHHHE